MHCRDVVKFNSLLTYIFMHTRSKRIHSLHLHNIFFFLFPTALKKYCNLQCIKYIYPAHPTHISFYNSHNVTWQKLLTMRNWETPSHFIILMRINCFILLIMSELYRKSAFTNSNKNLHTNFILLNIQWFLWFFTVQIDVLNFSIIKEWQLLI